MQLAECLHRTPVRTLLALCQANGFTCPSRAPKAELAAWLHVRLASRCRPAYLAQLPQDQATLLQALAQLPAPVPWAQFEARFGQIRDYRPWRQDAPRHPWRAPVSAAEALFYRGLIFVIQATGQPPHVALPDEVAALLRQPQPAAPDFAPAPPVARALLDLALLLAYLQQADVRPLHGRWLSPQHCQRLGACLTPPLPAGRLPSQRHSPRLAFAHYLAERLQLVTVAAGLLKPSPTALAWLEQSTAAQLGACWQTWLAPDDANRDLWRRFRMPGYTLRDPTGFARRVVGHLALASWDDLSDLLPWWEREQAHDHVVQDYVQDMLRGPLAGLSAIPDEADLSAARPPALTAIGAWLAAGHPTPLLPTPQPLRASDDLALVLPAVAPPMLAAILSLASWTELEPGPRLRFTPASLARAIGQDQSLSGLWTLCQRFVAQPLGRSLQASLQSWADQQRWVELRPALLLQASSSADLNELWADRSVRRRLGQRLVGDQASVRSADPTQLQRALAARGYTVRTASSPTDSTPALRTGDRWWLYTAGLIQRVLADRLGLAALPGAVLAGLQATLGPAEQAAAQAAAAAASAALQAAIDGPSDQPPHLPPDQIEQLLLDALQAGAVVQILYWSPWQGETTQRCVQPLALQWRGDHRYLIAHCHTANAQRTFRLDRILDLAVSKPLCAVPRPATRVHGLRPATPPLHPSRLAQTLRRLLAHPGEQGKLGQRVDHAAVDRILVQQPKLTVTHESVELVAAIGDHLGRQLVTLGRDLASDELVYLGRQRRGAEGLPLAGQAAKDAGGQREQQIHIAGAESGRRREAQRHPVGRRRLGQQRLLGGHARPALRLLRIGADRLQREGLAVDLHRSLFDQLAQQHMAQSVESLIGQHRVAHAVELLRRGAEAAVMTHQPPAQHRDGERLGADVAVQRIGQVRVALADQPQQQAVQRATQRSTQRRDLQWAQVDDEAGEHKLRASAPDKRTGRPEQR